MKPLTCEMCGSTDLVKQYGMFVCQNCGTKYSVEEAKRMMIVGSVDVSGSTVSIDTSRELANLYQIARRAKDENNGENAAKYYDMILVKDPTSWEASFYVVYFKAMECKIAQIQSAAISVRNCVNTVLKLIRQNVYDKDEQIKAVYEITMRCIVISSMLYEAAKKHYNDIDSSIKSEYNQEMIDRCWSAFGILYDLGDSIDSIFIDYPELHPTSVEAWKLGIELHNSLMIHLSQKEANKNRILNYVSKIQKYDPSYSAPSINTGGCYIATAVYGSYDCPQVWTLRRYRDYNLAKTWYGRVFIHIYYITSPTLVNWFGQTKWFKKMWKRKIDRMVADLNAKGVKDTPYDDKNW